MFLSNAARVSPGDYEDSRRLPKVSEIQTEVAAHFGVTRLDLISARRNRNLAQARQAAMWIARHTTTHSLPAIGRYFGNRDHTTVIHAIECVDRRRTADEGIEATLQALMEKLGRGNPRLVHDANVPSLVGKCYALRKKWSTVPSYPKVKLNSELKRCARGRTRASDRALDIALLGSERRSGGA
jgi:hypothetical protein